MPVLRIKRLLAAPPSRELAILLAILLLAGALRAYLSFAVLPDLTSTEAETGLLVRSVLGGQRPIFLDEATTHGGLEVYLTAPLFALFGETPGILRIAPLLASLVFVGATYALGRTIWNPRVARWSALFAAAGPALLVVAGVRAGAAALDALAAGTVGFAVLAAAVGRPGVRAGHFFAAGLFTGLAVWSHPLGIVYPLTVLLPALARWGGSRAEASGAGDISGTRSAPPLTARGRLTESLALAGGTILGAAPLLLRGLEQPGFFGAWFAGAQDFSTLRLVTSTRELVALSLPVASGLLQPVRATPNLAEFWAESRVWQLGGWVLLLAVYVSVLIHLAGDTRRSRPVGWWLAAPLFLVPPIYLVRAPTAAGEPQDLLPLYSSLPLIVAIAVLSPGYRSGVRRFVVFGSLLILFLSFTLSLDPGRYRPEVSAAPLPGSVQEVVAFLDEQGIDTLYAESSIATVITFETGGRIAGAAIRGPEALGWNPTPDTLSRVTGADRSAYVFVKNSIAERQFATRLVREGITADRGETDHFAVYYNASRRPEFRP